MAYLGNTPTTQNFVSGTDYFNGTGSQTAFTLSRTVGSINDIQVTVNNVVQQPNDAYTLSGTTLTMTSAPSSGTNNVYVRYLSTTTQVITPSQNTVGTAQLGTITNIASGNSSLTLQTGSSPTTAVTIDTSQNVGIGTSSPSAFGAGYISLCVNASTSPIVDLFVGGTRTASFNGTSTYSQVSTVTNTPLLLGTNGTERGRFDTSGNFLFNSGYGSVATAYGCRAWVNFNGTGTVAIRASGNVSSITDNGTGDYTVNFSTAMPDINYSTVASSSIAADGTFSIPVVDTKSVGGNAIVAPTTSAVRLTTQGNGGSAGARDAEYVNVTIVR